MVIFNSDECLQFSSVAQSCPTLCDPMDCSNPGLPVHHSYPLSRWCHPTISSSVIPFSSWLQSFPASGAFQMSKSFTSGGQRIVVSASTSVLSWNTQDWSPLSSLGIVTSVAVNIWGVCVFLWIIVFSAYVSNSGIVGSCAFSFCF